MFKTKEIILVGIFAALTAIGAFIKVPLPYIPFTLQFLFCAFAGLLLGGRLGALSQIVYVAVGLLGLPIFTQGGGISYVFQPSFGYLIGFIIAAYVIGKLAENTKKLTPIKSYLIVLSGLFFVYSIGVIYLYGIYNFYIGHKMSLYIAFFNGFFVIIFKDLVLSLFIALIAVKIVPILRKQISN